MKKENYTTTKIYAPIKNFRANSLHKYTKHLQYTLLNVKSRQTAIYIDMSLRYFVQKRSSNFF